MLVQRVGSKIYSRVQYDLWYDETTDKYSCTCRAKQFKVECKHIKEFRLEVAQLIKDEEIFRE